MTYSKRTPWKAGAGDGKWAVDHATSRAFGEAPIVDKNGVVVAIAVTARANEDDVSRRDLIIRAVNCHDDLVAALSGLLQVAVWDDEFTTEAQFDAAAAPARAALAKATGDTP